MKSVEAISNGDQGIDHAWFCLFFVIFAAYRPRTGDHLLLYGTTGVPDVRLSLMRQGDD